MSCKSMVYAVNTANQSVVENGIINFGSIVRRFGCNAYVSGGNGVVRGQGYYTIDTNITVTTTTASTVGISLYKDGVVIPGSEVAFTTSASGSMAISIPAAIRQLCDCESTITAVVSGAGVEVNNASVLIEKV